MSLLISITFLALCLVAPVLLFRNGKVSRWTVYFWAFFGLSAALNGLFMKYFSGSLYSWSNPDSWVAFVGPSLVLLPFMYLLYRLERDNRTPPLSAVIAFFGAFPVTALWVASSVLCPL